MEECKRRTTLKRYRLCRLSYRQGPDALVSSESRRRPPRSRKCPGPQSAWDSAGDRSPAWGIANGTHNSPAASLTSQVRLVCRSHGNIELYVLSHVSVMHPSRSELVQPISWNSLTRHSHTSIKHSRNRTLAARKRRYSRCDCSEKQGRLRSRFRGDRGLPPFVHAKGGREAQDLFCPAGDPRRSTIPASPCPRARPSFTSRPAIQALPRKSARHCRDSRWMAKLALVVRCVGKLYVLPLPVTDSRSQESRFSREAPTHESRDFPYPRSNASAISCHCPVSGLKSGPGVPFGGVAVRLRHDRNGGREETRLGLAMTEVRTLPRRLVFSRSHVCAEGGHQPNKQQTCP